MVAAVSRTFSRHEAEVDQMRNLFVNVPNKTFHISPPQYLPIPLNFAQPFFIPNSSSAVKFLWSSHLIPRGARPVNKHTAILSQDNTAQYTGK
jgi:hypothetical protein